MFTAALKMYSKLFFFFLRSHHINFTSWYFCYTYILIFFNTCFIWCGLFCKRGYAAIFSRLVMLFMNEWPCEGTYILMRKLTLGPIKLLSYTSSQVKNMLWIVGWLYKCMYHCHVYTLWHIRLQNDKLAVECHLRQKLFQMQ